MDQCPNCGQQIRSTARFCTSCGFRLPERRSSDVVTGQGEEHASSELASQWGAPATSTILPVPLDEVPGQQSTELVPVNGQSESTEHDLFASALPLSESTDDTELDGSAEDEAIAVPTELEKVVKEETISNVSENKITIALFHIERLRQLVPDLSGWSEEQAGAINQAIEHLEGAIKGREQEDAPYHGLRETVAAARKDPRDIDVMIALSDRAIDIEDLLAVHDRYSIGIRESLIALKPIAVESVKVPKKQSRRSSTTTRRRAAAKSTSATNGASKSRASSKSQDATTA
jgi:hypothetical protein